MFLPDDLPGDEGVDGFHPVSESEESESESESEFEESQDGDIGPEPEHVQGVDQDKMDNIGDAEDLGPNGLPLLNHAEQAEVEESQGSNIHLEIQKFGGKAGQPIRVGQPTAAGGYRTQPGCNPGGANPYAPFHSQTDWEVAKWGKLRGPTSTAFTELLKIPSVSSQAARIAKKSNRPHRFASHSGCHTQTPGNSMPLSTISLAAPSSRKVKSQLPAKSLICTIEISWNASNR